MSTDESAYTQAATDAIRAAAELEHDFGGGLTGVHEHVARERGGSDSLVVSRPGSWEAEHVRHLVAGADFLVKSGCRA
jgi:hypothetical protein